MVILEPTKSFLHPTILFQSNFTVLILKFCNKKKLAFEKLGAIPDLIIKKIFSWNFFVEFEFVGHPTAYTKLPTPYNSFSK